MPKQPQRLPYPIAPIKYDKGAQDPIPEDKVSEEEILKVQQMVGSIQYHARAVNLTALISLSTITSEQFEATGCTIKTMEQLLDYMVSNPDATIRF